MENKMVNKLASIASFSLAMALGAEPSAASSHPTSEEHYWITSWYAAPQSSWDASFVLPTNVPAYLNNQSLRENVRLSAGGQRIRLVFSNRYGKEPVLIGEVRVGVPGNSRPCQRLSFSGQASISILPGATVTSDPVPLSVKPLADLSVTTYLPSRTTVDSFHWGSQQTMQVTAGRATEAPYAKGGGRIEGRLFLSAVMVEAAEKRRTVVALGDSITDGNGSTPDANRRWPDYLAQRLAPYGVGVANAGISGARLVSDGMGQNALARLEQDVLSQPGVSDVIVLLGINDIGWPGSPFAPREAPMTLDRLTAAYRQLVSAAHVRGVRVTAATLPPFEGALEGTPFAGHYSRDKEQLRKRFNEWIRTAGVFDAVIDFDALLRDPANPQKIRKNFDSGDHLHPGDEGYRTMAEAIDITSLVKHGK
jgi:lysophospholipase L1-like esterase